MQLILIISLVIFLVLLIIPISIVLDSDKRLLKFSYGGLVSLQIILVDFTLKTYLKTPIKTFHIKKTTSIVKRKKQIKRKKKIKFNSWKVKEVLVESKSFLKQILRSFNLKNLSIYFDTGDYPLNAMLIPIITTISKGNINVAVNFIGINSIYFELRNRFIYIIFPVFFYIIKLFIILIRR